jgi:hypothetical protein
MNLGWIKREAADKVIPRFFAQLDWSIMVGVATGRGMAGSRPGSTRGSIATKF